MKNFGTIVKQKRESYGWTQKELADKLFISDKSISRWENSKGYPDITLLPAIAETLHLNYEELLNHNVYLRKRMKKRRKILQVLFAIFMILFILWGFSAFCKSEKERLSFRDSLFSMVSITSFWQVMMFFSLIRIK